MGQYPTICYVKRAICIFFILPMSWAIYKYLLVELIWKFDVVQENTTMATKCSNFRQSTTPCRNSFQVKFLVFSTPSSDPHFGLGTYFLCCSSAALLFTLLSFCPFGVPCPFGVHIPVMD